MKPLLLLLADSECASTFRGFFGREKFHQSLGCGPIQLNNANFDPEKDIRVHPAHDPGVWKDPQTILFAERHIYEKCLVILDEAWEGAPAPEKIIEDIEGLVETEAKWARDRFEVILIQPELEAWIWQRNPHVAEAFEFNGTDAQLWNFLAKQSLRLDAHKKKHRFIGANADGGSPPVWPKTQRKPQNPKGLVEALAYHCHSGPASGMFNEISSKISVTGCVDPAFVKLRDTLREWFPARGAAA
jgi:hypothetical protein